MRDAKSELLLLDGLHDGQELTGRQFVDFVDANPIDGVRTYICHPAAVELGKRCIGDVEIGSLFEPEIMDKDPRDLDEDRLAVRSIYDLWLHRNFWMVLDPHDAKFEGLDCLYTSEYPQSQALAVADLLGLQNIVIHPNYPFFFAHDDAVSIEISLQPADNPLLKPELWHRAISRMVDLGPVGMRDLGREVRNDLSYFEKKELMRIDANGKLDQKMIKIISQLEKIPHPGQVFTPISIPAELLGDLGIDPCLDGRNGKSVLVETWRDDNNSPRRPDLFGRYSDGSPKGTAFGSLFVPVKPPRDIHKWHEEFIVRGSKQQAA